MQLVGDLCPQLRPENGVHTIEGMVLTHKGKCFLKGGTCLKQKLLTYMSYFKIMRGDFTENS